MTPRFRAFGIASNYPGKPSDKMEMFYDVSVVTTYSDKEQHVIANFGMWNSEEYSGIELIDYTIMQSTGLFDKNGNEIFEGDIIVYLDDDGIASENVIIKYGKHVNMDSIFKEEPTHIGFYIEAKKGTATFDVDDMYNNFKDSIIVIGNIHQHPHLLEGYGR